MSTPTEYFGPHAKRWTNPRTGVTYSLKPRDYYQLVAEEKAKTEAEVAELTDTLRRALAEQSWPNVISMDTMYDRDLEPEAGLFKEKGALVAPLSGWNPPEHQRYDLEVESSPVIVPPEMAGRYDAIVYGATRGGIKYPTAESLVRGRIHSATLSDDGMGHVSSSPAAPVDLRSGERPAGRHWRHRRPQRIARWFAKFGRHPRLWVATGLVYIIAIIGVAAVTGVFS